MKCNQCGCELDNDRDTEFCPICGAPFASSGNGSNAQEEADDEGAELIAVPIYSSKWYIGARPNQFLYVPKADEEDVDSDGDTHEDQERKAAEDDRAYEGAAPEDQEFGVEEENGEYDEDREYEDSDEEDLECDEDIAEDRIEYKVVSVPASAISGKVDGVYSLFRDSIASDPIVKILKREAKEGWVLHSCTIVPMPSKLPGFITPEYYTLVFRRKREE